LGSDAFDPLSAIVAELASVAAHVDRAEMERLLDLMRGAKRVFVAGIGRSGLMARGIAMRLMHLDFAVYVVGETTTPSIAKGDLLICCTRYGKSRTLHTYVEKAHEVGAKAAIVTMTAKSPLAKRADEVFVIPIGTGGKSRQPLGTIFEQSLLVYCDALVMLAMRRLGISEEEMARRHTQLE
jgi:6-phospho-3-hexuloisomerase